MLPPAAYVDAPDKRAELKRRFLRYQVQLAGMTTHGRSHRATSRRREKGQGRESRYAPGAWYWTCSALRSASIVSSTVSRTVVSNELSAPPPLIASATAAMDTLSDRKSVV